MKKTILVVILALAVVTTGLAIAQGAPPDNATRAKQQFQMKMQVLRAKEAFRQKQQILRSGIIDKQQVAKARYMMKQIAMQRRETGATTYPKGEMLYRMAQRGESTAWHTGGIRGKQGFAGKQTIDNCPFREKIQSRTQGR